MNILAQKLLKTKDALHNRLVTITGIVCLFLCCLNIPTVSAQSFEEVFPGLDGPILLDSLVARFKPDTVLAYNLARDTLYSKVYALDDDSVRCVYSGHTLYLDPTQDPTQYVYLNGIANGINAEHSYPQSKGAATGFARSDMHHLYPTRIAVNEARGSLPYAEIPDNLTQRWYRGTELLNTQPASQNKDFYTEWSPTAFEPRESVKGNVARSVFYFYTMYRDYADAADPAFFQLQRPVLCEWNILDPVDDEEWVRTWRVAPYQDGKPNPYIIDCTLAYRTWCPNLPAECNVATKETAANPMEVRIIPHPIHDKGTIELQLPFAGTIDAEVFSVVGQSVLRFRLEHTPEGKINLPLDLSGFKSEQSWTGFLQIRLNDGQQQVTRVVPIFVL